MGRQRGRYVRGYSPISKCFDGRPEDTLTADQYYWSKRRQFSDCVVGKYKALWASVLLDAIKTLAMGSEYERDREKAWFKSKRYRVGSFLWICKHLRLNPDCVRKAILEGDLGILQSKVSYTRNYGTSVTLCNTSPQEEGEMATCVICGKEFESKDLTVWKCPECSEEGEWFRCKNCGLAYRRESYKMLDIPFNESLCPLCS